MENNDLKKLRTLTTKTADMLAELLEGQISLVAPDYQQSAREKIKELRSLSQEVAQSV